MKKQKAESWAQVSEGLVSENDITVIQTKKRPIVIPLVSTQNDGKVKLLSIVPVRGPAYDVISEGDRVNTRPYKYLSCAVRRVVKEYKTLIRTYQWKVPTKT